MKLLPGRSVASRRRRRHQQVFFAPLSESEPPAQVRSASISAKTSQRVSLDLFRHPVHRLCGWLRRPTSRATPIRSNRRGCRSASTPAWHGLPLQAPEVCSQSLPSPRVATSVQRYHKGRSLTTGACCVLWVNVTQETDGRAGRLPDVRGTMPRAKRPGMAHRGIRRTLASESHRTPGRWFRKDCRQ